MALTTSRLGVSLCPPNEVVEDRRFLILVLSPSAGIEDDFRPDGFLQTSKRPLLDREIVILPIVERPQKASTSTILG